VNRHFVIFKMAVWRLCLTGSAANAQVSVSSGGSAAVQRLLSDNIEGKFKQPGAPLDAQSQGHLVTMV
jgi:hypothetical protein